MSTFHVPSSTPPSTPPRSSNRFTLPSTTPAGPPPPSVFGSSQFAPTSLGRTFVAPNSSPPALSDGGNGDEDMADISMAFNAGNFGASRNAGSGIGLFRGSSRSPLKRQRVQDERTMVTDIVSLRQDFAGVAKGMAAAEGPAPLEEADDVILTTDATTSQLLHANPGEHDEWVTDISSELRELWEGTEYVGSDQEGHIGPNEDTGLAKASFVASLLLQLHHPSSAHRATKARPVRGVTQSKRLVPIPKVLLEWLEQHHDPLSQVLLDETTAFTDGFSAAPDFWNTIFNQILHGRFQQAINLLQGANFRVAATAEDDGFEDGYVGQALQAVDRVVFQAIELLGACPALEYDDWDIAGMKWTQYRREVRLIAAQMKEFAEGERASDDEDTGLAHSNYGFRSAASSRGFSLTASLRRAESKIPWSVYENLQNMYSHLLGSSDDIIASSFDWLEAVVGLAVWWDGTDEVESKGKGSLAASRRNLNIGSGRREVDVAPTSAYRKKLAENLTLVTASKKGEEDDGMEEEPNELQVNSTDIVEVGLACALTGNVDSVIDLLEIMSLPVACSVAEIASAGGWLDVSPNKKDIINSFDKSDLLVLGFTSQSELQQASKKDAILIEYAEAIANRKTFRWRDGRTVEGWELAVGLMSRLDDEAAASSHIGGLLERLPLIDAERVNKVVSLCHEFGMEKHATETAERYASRLEATTQSYGEALLYYARAHNVAKIRDVLDILTSLSIVQSVAFPPTNELDPILSRFLAAPKTALTELVRTDVNAARLLSTALSGYATLRQFYELRDEEVLKPIGKGRVSTSKTARERAAATALITVVQSAAASIRGGLYDPEVEVVVQVDGLLALLGESLVFLNRSIQVYTHTQLFVLLSAAEDLHAVGPSVRAQCAEVLTATLENYHSRAVPSPETLLRQSTRGKQGLEKSTSNLTASTAFSLVGSSLIGEKVGAGADEIRRAWDWRSGMKRGADIEDVLRILRLAVAKEVARAWT